MATIMVSIIIAVSSPSKQSLHTISYQIDDVANPWIYKIAEKSYYPWKSYIIIIIPWVSFVNVLNGIFQDQNP